MKFGDTILVFVDKDWGAYRRTAVSNRTGGAGTIYLKSSTQLYGGLIADNNGLATSVYSTPLRSVGRGNITGLTPTVLTDANADFPLPGPATGALGLIGLSLDPNINDADPTTFTIVDNTATTITVDAADGDLTLAATIGDEYIGVYTFENLSVINGARVETLDQVFFNSLDITGGELLADNVYQVGKKGASDSIWVKLAKGIKNIFASESDGSGHRNGTADFNRHEEAAVNHERKQRAAHRSQPVTG